MLNKKHPWEKYVIKDEDLVIELGDHLRLIASVDLTDGDEEPIHLEPEGQVYRAYDRKGAGWDLDLVSGDGPQHIRVLNGDVFLHFEVVGAKRRMRNDAVKDEDLAITLGDHLRLIAPVDLTEEGQEPVQLEPKRQIYQAYNRRSMWWDLKLISGEGVPYICTLNDEVLHYFEVVTGKDE